MAVWANLRPAGLMKVSVSAQQPDSNILIFYPASISCWTFQLSVFMVPHKFKIASWLPRQEMYVGLFAPLKYFLYLSIYLLLTFTPSTPAAVITLWNEEVITVTVTQWNKICWGELFKADQFDWWPVGRMRPCYTLIHQRFDHLS